MANTINKVGMREFRAHLPQYLLTEIPVAITRHGETIGFYIPAKTHHAKAEIDALKKAAVKLEKLLLSNGISEDELLSEFRDVREKKYKKSTKKKKKN